LSSTLLKILDKTTNNPQCKKEGTNLGSIHLFGEFEHFSILLFLLLLLLLLLINCGFLQNTPCRSPCGSRALVGGVVKSCRRQCGHDDRFSYCSTKRALPSKQPSHDSGLAKIPSSALSKPEAKSLLSIDFTNSRFWFNLSLVQSPILRKTAQAIYTSGGSLRQPAPQPSTLPYPTGHLAFAQLCLKA